MNRSIHVRIANAAVVAFAIAALGCSSTPEEPVEEVQEVSEFQAPADPTPPPVTRDPGADLDLGAIYFDYDSSSIRDDARPVLRANAESLRRANAEVTIEGHCDERGSEEYNLALGERRAASVRKYLANLGVGSNQMRTLSYGEAKPAAKGHDESAWRWNRRAEFGMR